MASVCRNLRKERNEARENPAVNSSFRRLFLFDPPCFLMNMSQKGVSQDSTEEIKDEEKESGVSSR